MHGDEDCDDCSDCYAEYCDDGKDHNRARKHCHNHKFADDVIDYICHRHNLVKTVMMMMMMECSGE